MVFPPQACPEPQHGFYAEEEMSVLLRTDASFLWYSQSHQALNGKMCAVPGLGPGPSNVPAQHLTKSHSSDQNGKGLHLDCISGTPASLGNKDKET